tara:strand:- start:530 stop:742 length:213 start_codon:yes stop_codon:yes gene_type:complete
MRNDRKDNMKKYKVIAGETIYVEYMTEIEANNKKEAEKIALDTCASDWESTDWSNSAGDFIIEDIEEIKD